MKARDIKAPVHARRAVLPPPEDLRESLRKYGQLQPIVTRKNGEVIIGERRRQALGRDADAKVVVMDLDEVDAPQLRLSEEFSKRDMTAIERGQSLDELRRLLEEEDDGKVTYGTLARRIGTTEATVKAYITLAGLPSSVKRMVERGDVGYREAEALAHADLKPAEKTGLARKFAEGKAPGGVQARKVVHFAESAPADVRQHLTSERRTTYWQAQHAVERKTSRARQQSAEELAAMKASAFFGRVLEKVKAWAISFDSLTELAPSVPRGARSDLKRWMTHLRNSIDKFIERMDEDEKPVPKRVLAVIERAEPDFD